MVKNDSGRGPLGHELEFDNRVNAHGPSAHSPRLDNSLARNEFKVTSGDITTEERKLAAQFPTDLRGLVGSRRQHAGFHDSTELDDPVELLGIGQGLVQALGRGLENNFLVDGFGRVRNCFEGADGNIDRSSEGERSAGQTKRRNQTSQPYGEVSSGGASG